jgi:hypothetical protein
LEQDLYSKFAPLPRGLGERLDELPRLVDQGISPRAIAGERARTVLRDERLVRAPSVKAARKLARRVRDALGLSSDARFDFGPLLAEVFEVEDVNLRAADGGCRALLQPVPGGFRICVDASPLRGRQQERRRRFLVAHEVAHASFYDWSRPRPKRLAGAPSRGEERFCNEFAASLLIPPPAIVSSSPTPSSLFALAKHFDVSTEVAARALAACHPERPVVALGYQYKGRLRLQWRGGSGATSGPLAELLTASGGTIATAAGRALEVARHFDDVRQQLAVVAV